MSNLWYICLIPLAFIAAITLTSRGEVIGNNRLAVALAMCLDLLVLGGILYLAMLFDLQLLSLAPFLGLWFIINFEAKIRAIVKNNPPNIMRAVKRGVLSLIPLNASFAAGFDNWSFGLFVLALLPVSMLLAKRFAVT